jgi:hypothetical protein
MARRRLLLTASLLLALLAFAQTNARPNFTGAWKMNPEKSTFGGPGGPESAQYVIRQSGAKIVMQYTQDGDKSTAEITPDATERLTQSGPESETWTRAYWSGAQLVVEARIKPVHGGNQLAIQWTSRWSLSEDKKLLTIERHIVPSGHEPVDQVVKFDRQ